MKYQCQATTKKGEPCKVFVPSPLTGKVSPGTAVATTTSGKRRDNALHCQL